MRYTDKIQYEVFSNEWTSEPEFVFFASVVPSESDVLRAIYKNTWLREDDDIFADRVGTNAVKPSFHIYRFGYSGILYYVHPKK
jgi:hypothetical protein